MNQPQGLFHILFMKILRNFFIDFQFQGLTINDDDLEIMNMFASRVYSIEEQFYKMQRIIWLCLNISSHIQRIQIEFHALRTTQNQILRNLMILMVLLMRIWHTLYQPMESLLNQMLYSQAVCAVIEISHFYLVYSATIEFNKYLGWYAKEHFLAQFVSSNKRISIIDLAKTKKKPHGNVNDFITRWRNLNLQFLRS